MCGIWGYVGRDAPISIADAWSGLCSLEERGPDDWGLYIEDAGKVTAESALPGGQTEIALGNRRLSILDLSAAGNQPMVADGRYWLVYNGEIYNYRELRTDLEALGYEFSSDSDTEVVLRAYQEFGTDCVDRFRGMFAFAIWDDEAEECFAARDRFGIKPFYYDLDENHFAFASELTALLDAGVTPRRLDETGVDGFLTYGSVPGPNTIIEGVQSLPPASTLTYERETGNCRIDQYWEPTFCGNAASTPERVRSLLEESIALRLRSDVPVGAFLSGGLDSSAIVALMREVRESDEPLHTYSIDFEESSYAEGEFAETVADAFDTEHTTKTVAAGDVREELPTVIAEMDQPTIDGINTYFVSSLAAEDRISVALSGLGSDEFFYGYPSFGQVPRLYRYASIVSPLPSPLRSIVASGLTGATRWFPSKPLQHLADVVNSDHPFGASYTAVRGLFASRRREALTGGPAVDWGAQVEETVADTLSKSGSEDSVSHAELRWYMQHQLLRDTDTMSMAHSLEVRVPFLDASFADMVANTAPSTKRRGEKGLLTDALSSELPDTVLQREKTGFTFPLSKWLTDELRPVVDDTLSHDLLERTPLDPDAVESVRQEFAAGNCHWSRLWALVVLTLWIHEHVVEE